VRCALLALLLAAVAHAGEPDKALLLADGIRDDAASLGQYLRSLVPDEETARRAVAAVHDLGASDPNRRHDALLLLGALETPPLEAIRDAAGSDDPEVRRAASRLLDEALRRIRKDLLHATLRTIADEGRKGLAAEVLAVVPLAAEVRLVPAADAALRATLVDGDVALLRRAAAAGDLDRRCAAVRALGAAPAASPDDALPWLGADDVRLRAAGALALADRGDARCLPTFLALLDAEDFHIRRAAADALRATVGGGTGYDSFASRESRADAIARWRKEATAKKDPAWQRPLPLAPRELGRTLISLYAENRVVELDAQGKRTFEVSGIDNPWALQGLPNGHRLVAQSTQSGIIEYDAEGVEVGRLEVPGHPTGFQRLDSGNTLVAVADQGRVIELKPDGSVARETYVAGQPIDVRLLDNGNLLVSLGQMQRVDEIDREGHVVWSLNLDGYVGSAERLENGNTLVAETGGGRVVEFDPGGHIVWERRGLQQCYCAQRLADGSTLVADTRGVREIAPDGKERWLLVSASFSRASRY
jgi:hypothetical protein